ncbi:hypothetical protein COL940_013044 [Colletotrichum noveboracense]|nr:hypothetical protein COL940_013044 [Colletotrichum noveboracense]
MSQLDSSDTVADYLPGENVMVLYLNDEISYEDSIYVSPRKICAWWKSPYQADCLHTEEWSMRKDRRAVYSLGRAPSGAFVSKSRTPNGEWVAGARDKVSTGHVQKGVVTVCKYEDIPQAVTADGSVVVPDMVVTMSSIVP